MRADFSGDLGGGARVCFVASFYFKSVVLKFIMELGKLVTLKSIPNAIRKFPEVILAQVGRSRVNLTGDASNWRETREIGGSRVRMDTDASYRRELAKREVAASWGEVGSERECYAKPHGLLELDKTAD
jgi:hypothetical protein